MPITLDVNTKLDDASARRTANEAQRYFQRAGVDAGNEFSRGLNRGFDGIDHSKVERQAIKLERAYDKTANAAGNLRKEESKLNDVLKDSNATETQKITQQERVARAHRANAAAVRDATRAVRDYNSESDSLVTNLRNVGNTAEAANSGISSASTAMSGLARTAAIGGPAIIALGIGIGELAGVAASAAQSIWLLPAAVGAAAVGFGTLKLATLGFGDALKDINDPKKFAEDLQSLSPNAQQAALSIKSLMPAFTNLKNATQDSLFAGAGEEINRLVNQYLPAVQTMTTGVASAFNSMFKGVADQLMTPQTQQALQEFMTNVVSAFRELAPAAAPFTKAMADIMAVGSGFLPGMARSITEAANSFSEFISQARESGQLKQWLTEGLDTLKDLGSMAWDLGRAFMSLAPTAREFLPRMVSVMEGFAYAMPIAAGGFNALNQSMRTMDPLIKGVGLAVDGIGTAFKAIPPIVNSVWSSVQPILEKLRTAIEAFLGPIRAAAKVAGIDIPELPQVGTVDLIDQGKSFGRVERSHAMPNAGLPNFWDRTVPTVPKKGDDVPYIDPSRYMLGANPIPGGVPYMPGGPQGQVDPQRVYDAESGVMRAKNNLERDRLRLLQMEAKGNTDQLELMRAKNQIAEDERAYQSAQMKLVEAQQGTVKKMKGLSAEMGEIGAQIDRDFGLSKGLPGLAENLTKFVANLAAAPLLGQLNAISQANPSKGGYGAMGILGARGAFGPQFTGIAQDSSYAASGIGPAATRPGGFGSDAALLANVPAGRYEQTQNADLTKGLADCSSAVEDLVNIMDGRPTGGRSMATGNAAEWLTQHGFLPGMGGLGDFRVGYNSGHMQATLPGGTPFNWGSDASAAKRGIGGTGADDPAFTSHYYRPTSGMTVPSPLPAPAAQAPAYAPLPGNALTNPGLTNPAPMPSGGWGGQTGPAQGWSPSATRIGGVEPASGSGKGGIGMTEGGTLDTAMSMAASGLDLLAPGAGQAAQTGMKLANRAIQYGGQVAGIGAQGLMDTFLPTGGSELANKSWITKIMGGIAGAAPALPNMAGKSTAPQAQKSGEQGGNTTTNTTNINVTNQRATEDGTGRDIAAAQMAQNQPPAMR